MWSLVTYSNCLEWNLLKEMMIINLSAVLLLKICLYLMLFITVLFNDYIHGIIFTVPDFLIFEYQLVLLCTVLKINLSQLKTTFLWIDFFKFNTPIRHFAAYLSVKYGNT